MAAQSCVLMMEELYKDILNPYFSCNTTDQLQGAPGALQRCLFPERRSQLTDSSQSDAEDEAEPPYSVVP